MGEKFKAWFGPNDGPKWFESLKNGDNTLPSSNDTLWFDALVDDVLVEDESDVG